MLMAGLLLGAGGWGAWRLREGRLPLEIGAPLLRGELLGHPVLRLRVRLGRGRPVTAYRVAATWVGLDGVHTALEVDDPGGRRIGPWTVTVRADGLEGGEVWVRVEADSAGRSWQAERSWAVDAAREGRFLPPVEGQAGGIRLVGVGWDRAEGEVERRMSPGP